MRFIAFSLAVTMSAIVTAQETPKSFPITFKADDVYVIADFSAESNGLSVTGKDIALVPIRCSAGVTGAMLIGHGTYSFSSPHADDSISGDFRAAMLRFHPDDQPSLVPLPDGTAITDHAAHEMGRHLLDNVFRHCWHSGMNALLPDTGSFVANVYSTTQGDLLISTGPKSNVVHSFTDNKTLVKVNTGG
mgnify:CR=1 FL=1|tara:strand:+ start:648 stop:1217 length:570 start_codon:yes stop_codon:yes gene_type:complete